MRGGSIRGADGDTMAPTWASCCLTSSSPARHSAGRAAARPWQDRRAGRRPARRSRHRGGGAPIRSEPAWRRRSCPAGHVLYPGLAPRRWSIPACAGEAPATQPPGGHHAVDPRVRGGGASNSFQGAVNQGRSPRARGRPVGMGDAQGADGSIPACAGEANVEQDPPTRSSGRSPRARGRRLRRLGRRRPRGSIPACAGEARAKKNPRRGAGVDPRVRGGGRRPGHTGPGRQGRSPRARGRRCAPPRRGR